MCKDPKKDPDLSFADFAAAAELDADNSDIYNHRYLLEKCYATLKTGAELYTMLSLNVFLS